MKISIRKSKHQAEDLTINQMRFAAECVEMFMRKGGEYMIYNGSRLAQEMSCDVYQTKTTISAIVRFKGDS